MSDIATLAFNFPRGCVMKPVSERLRYCYGLFDCVEHVLVSVAMAARVIENRYDETTCVLNIIHWLARMRDFSADGVMPDMCPASMIVYNN